MSPEPHRKMDELRAYVYELANACPLERCNPEDCPLFELRRLEPEARMDWLDALGESDLEYLASYHFVCSKLKLETWVAEQSVTQCLEPPGKMQRRIL